MNYAYDSGGRRERLTYPTPPTGAGLYLTYQYDPGGRLMSIRENGTTAIAPDRLSELADP